MKDLNEGLESPFYVAPDCHLVDRDFYLNRVWLPARKQHEKLGGTKTWLTALEMIDTYDGRLYFPDGRPFRHAGIVEVFSCDRWLRDFLTPDETGAHYKTMKRGFDRLRIIEAYCRLKSGIDWSAPPPSDGTLHTSLHHVPRRPPR